MCVRVCASLVDFLDVLGQGKIATAMRIYIFFVINNNNLNREIQISSNYLKLYELALSS